jgi:hypothetical protein
METGWGNQMNGNATFGFCCANVDMICLRFNSMGCVNNPACWSFIPHQAEGEKTFTVTFYELQKAVISLLKASTAKDCPFSSCSKDLLAAVHDDVKRGAKSHVFPMDEIAHMLMPRQWFLNRPQVHRS